MLNDWEARQLADIQRGLSSDNGLRRVLGAPGRGERLWLRFERLFYPVGYLLCALTYMTLAVDSSQRWTLLTAYLVVGAFWVFIEVRLLGVKTFVLDGLRGLGSR